MRRYSISVVVRTSRPPHAAGAPRLAKAAALAALVAACSSAPASPARHGDGGAPSLLVLDVPTSSELEAFWLPYLRVKDRLDLEGSREQRACCEVRFDPRVLTRDDARRIAATAEMALEHLPALTGRDLSDAFLPGARLLIYAVADELISMTPPAPTGAMGRRNGTPVVFLARAHEAREPTVHELAHLFVGGTSGSSLSEGIACHLQRLLEPGRRVAFDPARGDPDDWARAALARGASHALLGEVGSHRDAMPREGAAREAYYFLSESFVAWTAARFGVPALVRILRSADPERAWISITGRSRAALVATWLSALFRAPG